MKVSDKLKKGMIEHLQVEIRVKEQLRSILSSQAKACTVELARLYAQLRKLDPDA